MTRNNPDANPDAPVIDTVAGFKRAGEYTPECRFFNQNIWRWHSLNTVN